MNKKKVSEMIDLNESWYLQAEKLLLNKKIISVKWHRWDDEEFLNDEDYRGTGLVFITDDDTAFFLSSDDEGNDPGALHWSSAKEIDGRKYGVLPVGVSDYEEHLARIDSIGKNRSQVRAMLDK